MDAALIAIVSTVATVLMAVIGWLVWRDSRRAAVKAQDDARIKAIVEAAILPLAQQVHDLNMQLNSAVERQRQLQGDVRDLTDRLGRVLDRVTVVETKIEVFWKSVAMDAAKIIHSPNPKRREIDKLIEAFQEASEGRGEMTSEQYVRLQEVLHTMRDWEPGKDSEFPIYPGEQFAAAVLLRTMDHALESGQKGRRANG